MCHAEYIGNHICGGVGSSLHAIGGAPCEINWQMDMGPCNSEFVTNRKLHDNEM